VSTHHILHFPSKTMVLKPKMMTLHPGVITAPTLSPFVIYTLCPYSSPLLDRAFPREGVRGLPRI
jgi:hypothetical protein